jgi:hypothetical protein
MWTLFGTAAGAGIFLAVAKMTKGRYFGGLTAVLSIISIICGFVFGGLEFSAAFLEIFTGMKASSAEEWHIRVATFLFSLLVVVIPGTMIILFQKKR